MECKIAWFTGLSGSGKTTISLITHSLLRESAKEVLILDGDSVRKTIHRHLGYGPEDVFENNRLIAELCKDNIDNYDVILVPIISPLRKAREEAKKILGYRFYEIYVYASLNKVRQRDPKGYYEKFYSGELPGFIGVDESFPYEPPTYPHLTLNTESATAEQCALNLVCFLLGEDSDRSIS